jgi:hypothetical protein
MQIRLEQLWCPEYAEDTPCALCGEAFTLGVVVARASTPSGHDAGEVCPECALHLAAGRMGRARPEAFPDLEEALQAQAGIVDAYEAVVKAHQDTLRANSAARWALGEALRIVSEE